MATPPAAVLWDADGVLQHARRDWRDRLPQLDPEDPEGFLLALFVREQPALRGEESVQQVVEGLLRDRDLDPALAESATSLWDNIVVDEDAFALVAAVRELGIPCHLATNQVTYRRDLMLELGYADRFDRTFFSCDLRSAKPELGYFERVCAALDLEPAQVAFVDDNEGNIEAALRVGLRAVHHDPESGADGLRDIVRGWGITV